MPRIITPESNKKLKREYRLRFAIALFWAASAAVGFAVVLLIPSYALLDSYETAYATAKTGGQQEQLQRLNEEYASKLEDVHRLSQKIVRTKPAHSQALDLLFAYAADGIVLSAVELDEEAEGVAVSVRGVASTRSALLALEGKMQRDSRFSGFELPIEVLTKQSDIVFNVTFAYHEK